MPEIPDELKASYAAQAARRKANNIARGELRLKIEVRAIAAFEELWDSWIRVLGKESATDNLIEAMIRQHEIIRARLGYKGEGGPVKWVRVSAPKLQEDWSDRESSGHGEDEGAAPDADLPKP